MYPLRIKTPKAGVAVKPGDIMSAEVFCQHVGVDIKGGTGGFIMG